MRQSLFADLLDQLLQNGDPFAQPVQLFIAHAILFGITGVHIGLTQQLETAATELVVTRPGFDQRWRDRLGMAAQEIELVRLGAVEGQGEQHTMVEPFSRLMELKSCNICPAILFRE